MKATAMPDFSWLYMRSLAQGLAHRRCPVDMLDERVSTFRCNKYNLSYNYGWSGKVSRRAAI